MVGVRRSGGCQICLQRRVRCDQARPTCNNCKKGNRPCPGYEQDFKFHDESQRLRKRFEKSLQPQQGSDETFFASCTGQIQDATNATTGVSLESFDAENASLVILGQSEGPSTDRRGVVSIDACATQRCSLDGLLESKRDLYLGLHGTAPNYSISIDLDSHSSRHSRQNFISHHSTSCFPGALTDDIMPQRIETVYSPYLQQGQLLSIFCNSFAPEDERLSTLPIQLRNHHRWLGHLPSLTGTDKLLDAAVRAVTLVYIGRINNSQQFTNESRPYYGQALKILNSSLQDRQSANSNKTLCATVLLSLYEMFASDDNHTWIRHAGGAGALMKMRGPAQHRFGFDRAIFLAYRHALIVEAFQSGAPCFLTEPSWRQLSTFIHNDIKDCGLSTEWENIFDLAEDHYNVMIEIPELCREAKLHVHAHVDNLFDAHPLPTMPVASLIERLQETRFNFQSTFASVEAALKQIGYSPTITLNSRDPVCSVNYDFVNTFICSTFTGYWTIMGILNLWLCEFETQKDLRALYEIESRENALNIMRSTRFALTSAFFGPLFVTIGLRMALRVFEKSGGPECDWVIRRLFEIADRHIGIAKDVPGYESGLGVEEVLMRFKEVRMKAAKTEEEKQIWVQQLQQSEIRRKRDVCLDDVTETKQDSGVVDHDDQWNRSEVEDFGWMKDVRWAGLE